MKKEISNSHLKIGISWIIIMAILILSNGSNIKAETRDFSSSEQKKARILAPARTAADFDLLPKGESFAFESAALKFHGLRNTLPRNNIFRHLDHNRISRAFLTGSTSIISATG